MEEDTGKSLHVGGATGRIHGADHSLVDYNRAGIPLIEIVTKPLEGTGARAPAVARAYVAAAARPAARRSVSPTCGWSRARCAATPTCRCGRSQPTRARHAHRDQERQLAAQRRAGGPLRDHPAGRAARRRRPVVQETRHLHEDTGITTPGREKSDAEDYRYFPEPDLVPIAPSRDWVEELRATLPEPPAERRRRLQAEWGFTDLEMRDAGRTPARST